MGFDQCATFEPQPFAPMDMNDRPLAPMLTCSHLVTRTLATGRKQRWLSPPGETVTEENISLEEVLRRERLRLRETGITDYLWAEKANVMLLPLRGELYRWAEGSVTRLAGGGVIDPKLTDDGRRTFFVRDGDVWTIDDAGERRLTSHPPGTTNGLAEFVAQEDLGRLTGYWPSPSGTVVA